MSDRRGRASPLPTSLAGSSPAFAQLVAGAAQRLLPAARVALAAQTAREGAALYLLPARAVLGALVDARKVTPEALARAGDAAERGLASALTRSTAVRPADVSPTAPAPRALADEGALTGATAVLEALQVLTARDGFAVLDAEGALVSDEARRWLSRELGAHALGCDALASAVGAALSALLGPGVTTGPGLELPGGVRAARSADGTIRAWLDEQASGAEDEALSRSGMRLRGASLAGFESCAPAGSTSGRKREPR